MSSDSESDDFIMMTPPEIRNAAQEVIKNLTPEKSRGSSEPAPMSRWEYDTVFYRVFCITLLAVAFTFTVILTNVFVDIDGLLSKKDKGKAKAPEEQVQDDISEVMKAHLLADDVIPDAESDNSEDVYDDKDYQDSTDLYRSKRSLESQDLLYKIKNQKVKKILTNHLATLLDELDEEEPLTDNKKDQQEHTNDIQNKKKTDTKLEQSESKENENVKKQQHNDERKTKNKREESIDLKGIKDIKESVRKQRDGTTNEYDEELLHLAMHNMILEGIISNMNLDEVYTKVADLVKKFESNHSFVLNKDDFKNLFKDSIQLQNTIQQMEERTLIEKLFNQLLSKRSSTSETADKLNNPDTFEAILRSFSKSSSVDNEPTTVTKPKGHNVMIKTIIDITSLANDKTNKEGDLSSKDVLNGAIKLIYNGKAIKFKRVEDDSATSSPNISLNSSSKTTEETKQKNIEPTQQSHTHGHAQNSFYEKLINNYLKKIRKESKSSEHDELISRKRHKRHIKIRFDHEETTVKPQMKKEDDELFVEIETHFDSKGTKGEKKKKLIRELISKIQKALHSDNDGKKKKQKHWHVKKRTQDPLNSKSAASFINKLILPLETLAHRHIAPISKTVPLHDEMPLVSDSWGRNRWKSKYIGPRFFSKSINSAEMNTVDVDYNKVMRFNGIPQRLQKPINTDMSEEALQDNNVVDLGNIKFLMKEIGGSGFTVGFNQYTDEPPDPETMKLFNGIENIIKTYHQKYDPDPDSDTQQQDVDDINENNNFEYGNENQEYRQVNKLGEHLIERRSLKELDEPDYHSNEYDVIYKRNFLPFDSYQEIFKTDKRHQQPVIRHRDRSSLLLNDNLFEKKLKPGEILSIANLLQRRKRSMSVKKISNVRIKNNINRYLNTKSMASRSVFMNKKRSKRQVDKIRIVARDLPKSHKKVEEDIFVVSDEKVFADRAIVRAMEIPEIEPSDRLHSSGEHYDYVLPQKEEDSYGLLGPSEKETEEHYDIVSPHVYEPTSYDNQHNEYTRRARHNSLMSKYPHIIMEDASRSKEEVYPEEQYAFENVLENVPTKVHKTETFENGVVLPLLDMHSSNTQEISEGFIPSPKDNSNYKVTVKIRPKNSTGMAGYKEIHTSINKSYNKNGLVYTSLVNVSELSKVEKINKSINSRRGELDPQEITNLNQQQQLIKSLILQHKHRIDEQLKQLHVEKAKLESMNVDTVVLPDTFDGTVTLDPKKAIHLTKEEIGQLAKIEEVTTTKPSTTIKETTLTEPTTTTTTTTTITTTSTTTTERTTTEDAAKIQIIHTIEKNENMTNEILKKIDQNTNVLKIFLGKLLTKIGMTSEKENVETTTKTNPGTYIRIQEISTQKYNELNQTNNDIYQPKQMSYKPYNIEDYHQNIFLNNIQRPQNNNSMGIPFLYAIQKPFSSITSKGNPIASMVYHGHIHTDVNNKEQYFRTDNTKPELYKPDIKSDNRDMFNTQKPDAAENKGVGKEIWQASPGEKVLHNFVRQNSSRFFIDELTDFKVIPLITKKDYNPIAIPRNGTHA